MPTPELAQIQRTGHAVLVSAHHAPDFLCDRNPGLVIGLEYVAAMLEHRGWSVDMICGPRGKNELVRRLNAREASFVGISSTTEAYRHAVELARVVRDLTRKIPVLLGGYHASIYGGEILRHSDEFDIVVIGEGEPIVDEIALGVPLGEIRGLAFRCGNRIVETPHREPIADLDSLPWPVRGRFGSSFRMEESFGMYPHVNLGSSRESAYVITTRGCNNRCAFCRSACIPRLRQRSVSNVIEELEGLAATGVRFINFADPNFLHDSSRVEAFARCLRELGMRWTCLSRPEHLTDRLCRTMVDSHCVLVGVGIETINTELRRYYRKGRTVEAVRVGLAAARRSGLLTMAFMMIGPLPGLSYVRDDIDFLIDAGLDFVRVCPLEYLPGTDLWFAACNDGRISSSWTDRPLPLTKVDKTIHEEEVSAAVRYYFQRFYYRPTYLVNQLFKILLRGKWPGRHVTPGMILTLCMTMAKSIVYQIMEAVRRLRTVRK